MTVDRARTILAVIWLAFGGMLFALLIVQTVAGYYDFENVHLTKQVWNWTLPLFVPTLSLMLGVFAANALSVPDVNPPRVRRGFFLLAAALSIAYFLLIFGTFIINAVTTHRSNAPTELMDTSNLWIVPVQGFVASALGVFFASKEKA